MGLVNELFEVMLSIGYASDDLVMFRIFYMLWCGDVEGSQWHSFQVAERSSLRKKGRQENAAMCSAALGAHVSTARDGCQVVMLPIHPPTLLYLWLFNFIFIGDGAPHPAY